MIPSARVKDTVDDLDSRSVSFVGRTGDSNLHQPVSCRGVGNLNNELSRDSLLSICRIYSLEVEFFRREDDRISFIVCRNVKHGLEKEILFLLPVCGARSVGFPPISLHVAIAKLAMKTSGWGTSFLRLDLRCRPSCLRVFDMFPALYV